MKIIKRIIEVYLLIYLILFIGFRYQISNPDIFNYSIGVLASLAVYLILTMIIEKRPLALPPNAGVYVIFILAYITSVIHSVNYGRSENELILFAIAAFMFFGTINLIRAGWDNNNLLDSLLLVGLFYNVVKLSQILIGVIVQGWPDLCIRQSLVPSANKTASMAALILALSMAILIERKTPREKTIPGIIVVSSIILLFLTGSRGGYLAGVAGVATVLLINLFYGRLGYLLRPEVRIVAVGTLMLFPIIGTLVMRPAECTAVWTSNITIRYDLWDTALKIFTDYPVLGSGPGGYAAIAGPIFNYHETSIHPHNIYLLILSERGLIGLLSGALMLLTITKTLLMDVRNIALKSAALGALATFLVHGLTDVAIEPYIIRYLVMILALAVAAAPDQGELTNG